MNIELKSLQLMNLGECRKVIRKDIPQMTTLEKEYEEENLLSYFCLCNTWLHLLKEHAGITWISCKEHMLHYGIVDFIRVGNDCSLSYVRDRSIPHPLFQSVYNAIRLRRPEISDSIKPNVTEEPEALFLQLCRFGKRFSPLRNDKISSASKSAFLGVENEVKMWQRRGMPVWLKQELRAIVSELLDWDTVCDELSAVSLEDIQFGSGSCYDASDKLGDKLVQVAHTFPEYFKSPMGIPYIGCRPDRGHDYPRLVEEDDWSVKILAVPKSFKASRIIAMEPVVRQGYALAYAKVLQRHLPGWLNIQDQGRNQELAAAGSMDGGWCTQDASNASDRISWAFVQDVFPPRFVRFVQRVRPLYTILDGKKRLLQMALPSGNGLTFVVESLAYGAIAQLCAETHERFGVELPRFSLNDGDFLVSAYGDDVVMPSACAEMAETIYRMCGFKINPDKTYADGHYRESCGEEFIGGTCVSSIYYPRFPVPGRITENGKIRFSDQTFRDSYRGKIDNSLTMLVSLQQRLLAVSPAASFFVKQLIRTAEPRMTSSLFGNASTDLWDYSAVVRQVDHSRRFGADVRKRTLDAAAEWDAVHGLGLHASPTMTFRTPSQISDEKIRVLNNYNYQQFLRYGPKYDGPLEELLGVSSPGVSYEQAFGKGKLTVRFIYR